jgi:hypothetical protein
MRDRRFAGRDAWMAAVDLALGRSSALPVLAAKGLDPVTVRAVALAEASGAAAGGITCLNPDELARMAGIPRSAVLKARLVLVELGLADLVAHPCAPGVIQRQLHHE